MSASIGTDLQRRAVMAAGLGVVVPAALAIAPAERSALEDLRRELGLEQLAAVLGRRLAADAELNAQTRSFAQTGVHRIKECVGGELVTAVHSLPSLVLEDCLAGRLLNVGGLSFTPTELALLLA